MKVGESKGNTLVWR